MAMVAELPWVLARSVGWLVAFCRSASRGNGSSSLAMAVAQLPLPWLLSYIGNGSCSVGRLVSWMAGCMAGWLIWLVGWLVGWLV